MSFEAQTVTEIVALEILKLANPIDHAASHWRPIIFMVRLAHHVLAMAVPDAVFGQQIIACR